MRTYSGNGGGHNIVSNNVSRTGFGVCRSAVGGTGFVVGGQLRSRNAVDGIGFVVGGQLRSRNAVGGTGFEVGE